MKINEKILQLVKSGLKATMLTTLSESQINKLHSRLVESKKITNEIQTITTTKLVATPDEVKKGVNIQGKSIAKEMPNGTVEFTEQSEEVDEKFESKKQQKYFFAKCGEGKTKEQKKWCKMADEFAKKTNFDKLPEKKTETNEEGEAVYQKTAENLMAKTFQNSAQKTLPGFTIGESNLEKQITRLVEKHISPKMSKQDFINTIKNVMVESPEIAEPKPKEKEIGTPTREKEYSPAKPLEDDPFRRGPRERERPAPRAEVNGDELPEWLTSKAIGF
jgi:hypothetical protein